MPGCAAEGTGFAVLQPGPMLFKLRNFFQEGQFPQQAFLLGAVLPQQAPLQEPAQGLFALLQPFCRRLQFPLPNAGLLLTLVERLARQGQGRRGPFLSRLLLQDFLLPDKQVAELFLNTSQSADQPFIPGMIPEVSVHEIQPFLSPGALFQLPPPGRT